MINRVEIEDIMGQVPADIEDPEGIDERNEQRRSLVVAWMDEHPERNYSGPMNRMAFEMILDDLSSYSAWERSG